MRNATTERNALFLGVVAMGLVVYISNVLVEMPINDWLTYGAQLSIAFLVTDLTSRILGASAARKWLPPGLSSSCLVAPVCRCPDRHRKRISLSCSAATRRSNLRQTAPPELVESTSRLVTSRVGR